MQGFRISSRALHTYLQRGLPPQWGVPGPREEHRGELCAASSGGRGGAQRRLGEGQTPGGEGSPRFTGLLILSNTVHSVFCQR